MNDVSPLPVVEGFLPYAMETLSDGRQVLIRPMNPGDADAERVFIEALSPQSRRYRFQEQMTEASPELVERLVNVDHVNDEAFGARCPSLDRRLLQLHRHPRRRLPFRQRPVRDDRADGQRKTADAGVFDRERELGGTPGVLLDQGPGRSADLAPAAHPARRRSDAVAQADRHAADQRRASGAQPVPAGDGHGPGAVPVDHQGPGNLRALRARDPDARRAQCRRPGLPRLSRARDAAPRVPGRADPAEVPLLPGREPRAVPAPWPHHHAVRQRPMPVRPRHRGAGSGPRPRHDLRQPADARRLPPDPRQPRLQGRPAHRHARRIRLRARLRRHRQAGGLAQWTPGPVRPVSASTWQRELWRHLQTWTADPTRTRQVWLAYGDRDRLRDAIGVLAPVLPADRVLVRPGGHAWTVWTPAAAELLRRADAAARWANPATPQSSP
jgi:hypothetical protein